MDICEQVRLAKSSLHVHSDWYRQTFPEVAALGLDPAEHYLRFGAAMNRNPDKNFDTRFYLDTYPEAVRSGLNPLIHFVLHGRENGYLWRPPKADGSSLVNNIRNKLLSLGFTERPLQELNELLSTSPEPEIRALAALELALWYFRAKTEEGYRSALAYIARARAYAPSLDFRSKLATVELLCHFHLGETSAGRSCYERAALAGEVTPDVMLAWVNFQPTPRRRVAWINAMLDRYGIEPVQLLPDDGRAPCDRLTCTVDLSKVSDGPKVTVLVAAYDAADMLPTALRSLQEQTWQNLEIIVLDDCSPTPDTMEVAHRFAATDPRIRVIRMAENGGAYVARNRGLDEATGKYVTLHDADDWSHPRKIEMQVRFMMENPEVMGTTTEQARTSDDLKFSQIRSNGAFVIFNTSSFMFRPSPMRERLGYWDTARFGADNELIRRMRTAFGEREVRRILSGPLSFQREASSSVTEDSIKGVKGFYYGVRHEYFSAQIHKHRNPDNLRYSGDPKRLPFPRPPIMNAQNRPPSNRVFHFDVIFCADFRCATPKVIEIVDEIEELRKAGKRIGLVNYYDYDLDAPSIQNCPEIYVVVDGVGVRFIVFGEKASCDRLVGPEITKSAIRNRYTPEVTLLDR